VPLKPARAGRVSVIRAPVCQNCGRGRGRHQPLDRQRRIERMNDAGLHSGVGPHERDGHSHRNERESEPEGIRRAPRQVSRHRNMNGVSAARRSARGASKTRSDRAPWPLSFDAGEL
jgi:hypothetical protein